MMAQSDVAAAIRDWLTVDGVCVIQAVADPESWYRRSDDGIWLEIPETIVMSWLSSGIQSLPAVKTAVGGYGWDWLVGVRELFRAQGLHADRDALAKATKPKRGR